MSNLWSAELKVGDTVYYFLRRSPRYGRSTDWYLEATVLSINKWVRIQPKNSRWSRNAAPQNLVLRPPEGAVVK